MDQINSANANKKVPHGSVLLSVKSMPLEPRYEWKTSEEEACEEFQTIVCDSYYNQYIELQKENDTLRSYISELRDAIDVYILYIKNIFVLTFIFYYANIGFSE